MAPTDSTACWSPDGKAIAYTYLRLDKQPIIGRTAVRQLGGKERFLSRWSTDLFLDVRLEPERGLARHVLDLSRKSRLGSVARWRIPKPTKPDRVLISKPDTEFLAGAASHRMAGG